MTIRLDHRSTLAVDAHDLGYARLEPRHHLGVRMSEAIDRAAALQRPLPIAAALRGWRPFWLVVPAHRPHGIAVEWSDVAALAALGGLFVAVFLRIAPAAAIAVVRHPEAANRG